MDNSRNITMMLRAIWHTITGETRHHISGCEVQLAEHLTDLERLEEEETLTQYASLLKERLESMG